MFILFALFKIEDYKGFFHMCHLINILTPLQLSHTTSDISLAYSKTNHKQQVMLS
jgi:hypothetical protein